MRFDGQRLKQLRLERCWDQHRLAEEARKHSTGITQSQISRYESGHQEPSGRNALALARALGVEVAELYASDVDSSDEDEGIGAEVLSLDDFLLARIRQGIQQVFREEAEKALARSGS